MAPRPLIVRWRKYKAKRRRETPKAFATKASASFMHHTMKTEAIFRGRDRVGDVQIERLKHYISRHKPHHRILYMLFEPAIREVVSESTDDPRMAVELLIARYAAQDESLKVFEYDVVRLEHSDFHEVLMYFRGTDCFMVYLKRGWAKKSMHYSSTEYLKSLPLTKIKWAGEPVYVGDKLDSSED
jgi:hypothetical protein